MIEPIELHTPLTGEACEKLRAGDAVLLSGTVLTGRDTAHRRLFEAIVRGDELPVDLEGMVMFYAGPTPARPGRVIGSVGPTTSGRMDAYTPALLERGLRGMIGKGKRSSEVKEAIVRYGAVYFAAMGGVAALLSRSVVEARVVAYEELGPEAIRMLKVERFPLFVINDCRGNDLYEDAVRNHQFSTF
ncbi:MAG: Fe-S-containing hydro-lyase [Deltaproteobacteria bacterium]|nr:Fe-S-containing hydro-lyase [Deltaproteobacteria bacterium]